MKNYLTENKIVYITVVLSVLSFSISYLLLAMDKSWLPGGDTLNSFGMYFYYYAGLMRGEYVLWNPLIRAGQPELFLNLFQQINPIFNIISIVNIFFGNKDALLSFIIIQIFLTVIFASGMYKVFSLFGSSKIAAAFVFILTLFSSIALSGISQNYFLIMIYSVPWVIYSGYKFLFTSEIKYCFLFAVSMGAFFYSYLFTMGLLFITVMIFIFIMMHFRLSIIKLKKITEKKYKDILLVIFLLLLMVFPLIITATQAYSTSVSFSRMTNFRFDDSLNLLYDNNYGKIQLNLENAPKGIISFFSGFFAIIRDLHDGIGFPAIIFFIFAISMLFKKNSNKNIFAFIIISVIMTCLSYNLLPFSLLIKLPGFNSIRNISFLLQFAVLGCILISGLGVQGFVDDEKKLVSKIKWIFLFSFLFIIGFQIYNWKDLNNYDIKITFLYQAMIILISVLYWIKKINSGKIILMSTLLIAVLAINNNWKNAKGLSGGIVNCQQLKVLRNIDDPSLNFSFDRPSTIKVLHNGTGECSDILTKLGSDFGMDEYSSVATLSDNAYLTNRLPFGLSSYPSLKTFLKLSMSDSDQILQKKFYYFSKVLVSDEFKDMKIFISNPGLITKLANNGVGISDKFVKNNIVMGRLFEYNECQLNEIKADKPKFTISNIKYLANSLNLKITTDECGYFVYTDMNDGNWTAKIDGKPAILSTAYNSVKGLYLEKGTHDIEYKYSNILLFFIYLTNAIFLILIVLLFYCYRLKWSYSFNWEIFKSKIKGLLE